MKRYFALTAGLARAAVLIALAVADALCGDPSLIPDAFDALVASAKAIHNLGDAATGSIEAHAMDGQQPRHAKSRPC